MTLKLTYSLESICLATPNEIASIKGAAVLASLHHLELLSLRGTIYYKQVIYDLYVSC